MSELRKDPVTGCWVVLSAERGLRPRPPDFRLEKTVPRPSFCPFCQGHEDKTPPEVFALRHGNSRANGPGWRIRVVPNKFPALTREGELNPRGEGIYDVMNGVGTHEIMIEGPSHFTRPTQLPWDLFPDILEVYRLRLLAAAKDARFRYGLVFKNVGTDAGASLDHNHSQLIATPVIPHTVAEEMAGAQRFHHYRGRCIFCDILRQELQEGKRVVLEGTHFLVLAPFASRFPFETWILPKTHKAHFSSISGEELKELAEILYQVLKNLDRSLENPPFNYVIHTAPFSEGETPHYHWHIEILPRVQRLAGFEFGTGFFINSVAPEEAARELQRHIET